jgi:rRNA maturation endonuclease Nob1
MPKCFECEAIIPDGIRPTNCPSCGEPLLEGE